MTSLKNEDFRIPPGGVHRNSKAIKTSVFAPSMLKKWQSRTCIFSILHVFENIEIWALAYTRAPFGVFSKLLGSLFLGNEFLEKSSVTNTTAQFSSCSRVWNEKRFLILWKKYVFLIACHGFWSPGWVTGRTWNHSWVLGGASLASSCPKEPLGTLRSTQNGLKIDQTFV